MSRQDLSIKNDPYTATFLSATDEADNYRVQSSTDPDIAYRTSLHRDGPDFDSCSCPARVVPCNHIDRARLRQQIERVEANSAALYFTWQMAELQDEDQRIRTLLAEADSWLLRAQYGCVADRIAELLDKQIAA